MSSSKEKRKQDAAALQKVREIICRPRSKMKLQRKEDNFSKRLLRNCPDLFTSDDDEDEDEEEDEAEKEFIVERILARHLKFPIYLIDWHGCEPEEDSWEPRSSLIECELSLKEFYKSPHRIQNGIIWTDLPEEKERLWLNKSHSAEKLERLASEYIQLKLITEDDVSNDRINNHRRKSNL